jgi:hypothetical protein
MKKALSIILAVFCISLLHTYADNDKSNQCTVQIEVKKYLWQQGIERSLDQYVDAYLNLNSNTIEIDFSGLGEGEIYIIDQNNQVVNIAPIFAGDTYLIMNQPETTGYYTLIIISNEYYGEGYFCIE